MYKNTFEASHNCCFNKEEKGRYFNNIITFILFIIITNEAIIGNSKAAAIVKDRPISELLPPTFSDNIN